MSLYLSIIICGDEISSKSGGQIYFMCVCVCLWDDQLIAKLRMHDRALGIHNAYPSILRDLLLRFWWSKLFVG